MTRSPSAVSPIGLALHAVAIVMVVWSARSLVEFGNLAVRLAGRPLVERGTIASDEWADPLARAGRPRLQAAFEEARRGGSLQGRNSTVAAGWAWIVRTEPGLPRDARIYLNLPNEILYYYATSLWYPRRVEVGAGSTPIANGEALRAAAVRAGPGRWGDLRASGFTHVIDADAGGLRLSDLRDRRTSPDP